MVSLREYLNIGENLSKAKYLYLFGCFDFSDTHTVAVGMDFGYGISRILPLGSSKSLQRRNLLFADRRRWRADAMQRLIKVDRIHMHSQRSDWRPAASTACKVVAHDSILLSNFILV